MFNHKTGQTSLDLSSVKSADPAKLIKTDVTLDRDKNFQYTERGLEILSWGAINIHDPQQVYDRISLFFSDCQERNMKPSVSALALALGISRQYLYYFVRGEAVLARSFDQSIIDMIQKAYQLLDVLWEDYMLNGKINPVSGIFLGKNHFGYRDVQDVVLTPGLAAPATSLADLDHKYAELPDAPDARDMLPNTQENRPDA